MVRFYVSLGSEMDAFKHLIVRRRRMHMHMPSKAIAGAAQSVEVPSAPVVEFRIHFHTYSTEREILLGGRSAHTE